MTDHLEAHIEAVLNVLENQKSSNKLIVEVRSHCISLFDYLTEEYELDLSETEFDFLEYGAFLICSVLFNHDKEYQTDLDRFEELEEKYCALVEEDKTFIKKAFTKISLINPKIGLYNLAEEYYFTLEEEKLSPLPRNIIAIVMISLIEAYPSAGSTE